MESKLRLDSNSCSRSAGTTGTTSVVAIVPAQSHRFLNHLVCMVAVVAILLLFAVGETNCQLYIGKYPKASHGPQGAP
jgi:hypothetical protein